MIVDFVGYGTTPNCFEGAGQAPAPSTTTEVVRYQSGCAEMNQNQSDFTTRAPAPVNSASSPLVCGCYAMNESNTSTEADYCVTQFPLDISTEVALISTVMTYGQIYETVITPPAGADSAVRVQVGMGFPSVNPQYQAWEWRNANFNVQAGNNDEYMGTFATGFEAGSYRYAYRFSLDHGVSWTYCDKDGAGSNPGLTFSLDQLATVTLY